MDWSKIVLSILGIITAIVGAGFVFKKISKTSYKSESSIRIISQKNNTANGDIVAGNKTTTINNK